MKKILAKKALIILLLVLPILALSGCTNPNEAIQKGCDEIEANFGTDVNLCIPPQGNLLAYMVQLSGQGDASLTSKVYVKCTRGLFNVWKVPEVNVTSCTDGCVLKSDGTPVCGEELTAAVSAS